MIPHRFARLLGAVLLLAPSLAFGQAALQQPGQSEIIPSVVSKLYGNDLFLQGLIASRFNTLGAAALLNVGTVTGTVADGGFVTAEIARAKAAEQTNATAIQTNATAIAAEIGRAQGVELQKAPIASPAFTGVPTAPTAANGTNSNQIATTAFVLNNVGSGSGGGGGGGSGGVPPTRQLNVGGLLQGGGDLTTDRTFTVPAASQSDVATGTDQTKALTPFSIAAALGAKAPLASPAFVGFPTAPTAPAGTSSTVLATTGFVSGALGSYAPLASPALTGTPTAPTPAAGDSSATIPNTAFVTAAIGASNQSLSPSGYKKLPGGLIFQWITTNFAAAGISDGALTWPIPCPNAILSLAGQVETSDTAANILYALKMDGANTTGVNARIRYVLNGGTVGASTSGVVHVITVCY